MRAWHELLIKNQLGTFKEILDRRHLREGVPPKDVFETAWKSYCSMNQRLRDPRALSKIARAGVPEEFRADVWAHCLGLDVPAIIAEIDRVDGSEAESSSEVRTDDEEIPECTATLIDADIARTFPNNVQFEAVGGAATLRRILRRLAADDADIGYCQSLNFVSAVFLMTMNDERLAVASVQKLLLKLGTRGWYTSGMSQLRADTVVFQDLIRERLPLVHEAFKNQNFDVLFITSKWFLCVFATTLSDEVLHRVWDAVVCDGIEAVFRVALALLARRQEDVVGATHVQLIQMFQEKQVGNALLRSAYNPALWTLSRFELSQRRQQAQQRLAATDARDEMRWNAFVRGGVRPGSILPLVEGKA